MALAAAAWNDNVELAATPQAPTVSEGVTWDDAQYRAPLNFDSTSEIGVSFADENEEDEEIEESTGTPSSLYMIGSVVVGVVVVSRDQGAEQLTTAEHRHILQQVEQGLDFLANAEPRARLTFVYDYQPITVDVAPGPDATIGGRYERFERGWRDAALAEMGYAAGRDGYRRYVDDIRGRYQTDWAYVAFFTKYPLNHFAYAIWEKLVMHYDNDGWGSENIHRVFAHESCHIFGAADEYGSCACGGQHGYLQAPNNNCVNCFPPGTQERCLMNRNVLTMCDHSRRQIGWDPSLFPNP